MDVSVIGTSFSGLATSMYLVSQGFKPNLYDSGSIHVENIEINSNPNPALLKNPLNISTMSQNRQYFNIPENIKFNFENKVNVRPTYIKGGFSGLWGGSVNAYSVDSRKILDNENDLWRRAENFINSFFTIKSNSQIDNLKKVDGNIFDKTEIYDNIYNISKIGNYFIEIKESTFAVDKKNVNSDEKNFLDKFNTKSLIDELITRDLINYYPNYTLRKFLESSDNIKLIFDNNEFEKIKYTQKLFVGGGVIASAKILLDSGKFSKIKIKDTQLYFMPTLSLKTNKFNQRKNEDIPFPSLFMSIKRKLNVEIFYQYYPMNRMIKERIFLMIPKQLKFLKPIVMIFLKRIGVVFGYLPMNKSGEIILRNDINNVTQVHLKRNSSIKYSYILKIITIINFFKVGVLPFTFFSKRAGVGESYHMGASTFVNSKGYETPLADKNGLVYNSKNIYLVDSSSLLNLEAGPITYEMMINAVRIVMKAIRK